LAEFARNSLGMNSVHIDPTGTNAGFQKFCSAKTSHEVPLAMASKRFPSNERQQCAEQLGASVQEHVLGLNAVTLVVQRRSIMQEAPLSRAQLFLALAAEIPDQKQDCKLVQNPYKTWSDISSDLPDTEIVVWGPSATSGTYSSFIDGALINGAKQNTCMQSLDSKVAGTLKKVAKAIRQDGAWKTLGEDDLEVAVRLHEAPNEIGIVGFTSAHRFKSHLKPLAVDGVAPTKLSLVDGSYPLSGRLYMYANEDALSENPTAAAFLKGLTDDAMIGSGGALTEQGLISVR